jgi:hypothetical protein
MKKIIALAFALFLFGNVFAQNEGRLGFFTGINNTRLSNPQDKAFGDYLPTFKSNLGIDAAYHFTLAKVIASALGSEFSFTSLGQNYRGAYQDGTSYFAYSRLRYVRMGLYFNVGTPMRKTVAVTYGAGLSYGFLSGYQDRYELVRNNNSRYIIDVKNTNIEFTDTSTVKGALSAPLYNKTDLTFFNKLGVDFLFGENLVFSIYGRMDMGLQGVENLTKFTYTSLTTPSITADYKPYHSVLKYRTPVTTTIKRSETKNVYGGIYLALHYRIWDKNKTEYWYKQRTRAAR